MVELSEACSEGFCRNSNCQRWVAGWMAGLCAVLMFYAAHVGGSRASMMMDISMDFDIELPLLTKLAFKLRWVPVIVSGVGCVVGVASVWRPHRVLVIICSFLVVLSFASVIVVDVGLQEMFISIMHSMTGQG